MEFKADNLVKLKADHHWQKTDLCKSSQYSPGSVNSLLLALIIRGSLSGVDFINFYARIFWMQNSTPFVANGIWQMEHRFGEF